MLAAWSARSQISHLLCAGTLWLCAGRPECRLLPARAKSGAASPHVMPSGRLVWHTPPVTRSVRFEDTGIDVLSGGCRRNKEIGKWKSMAPACPGLPVGTGAARGGAWGVGGKQGTRSGRWGLEGDAPHTQWRPVCPLCMDWSESHCSEALQPLLPIFSRLKLSVCPLHGWCIRGNTEISWESWFFWNFSWNPVWISWLVNVMIVAS